ncbi:uncharacterized protein LOC115625422 [Scaptodrosophila lebanonensis]|uniref:Uncharacterized protein LOC115625422 n=1 Tax=Drosophila lebanonensis TaxID=7225 RepID=A0A6J2TMV4_DROLE|nr:uncharacterized protein LOC115625422 [Scaptodrosophila lebanonensis]
MWKQRQTKRSSSRILKQNVMRRMKQKRNNKVINICDKRSYNLYPKAFKTKTTEAPKISTTQSYVWIPGTNWRFKAQHVPPYQLVPFKPLGYERPPPKPKHRIDVSPPTYANPNKWQKWSKYGQNNTYWRPEYEHYKKYKYAQVGQPAANMKWRKRPTGSSKYDHYIDNWTSHGQHVQSWKSDVPDKWSKWTTVSPKWTNYGNRCAPYELYDYADLTALRDWRHYHAHRDRRQLFDQLSGFSRLLGFDVKTCILRAMCDSKRLLLPPGYSMMQDIIRLIFTMPTITGVEDEYSQAMRMDPEHCAQHFRQQCKVDILAWLFSGH